MKNEGFLMGMGLLRNFFAVLGALVLTICPLGENAFAQTYPIKPITLVVPFSARFWYSKNVT